MMVVSQVIHRTAVQGFIRITIFVSVVFVYDQTLEECYVGIAVRIIVAIEMYLPGIVVQRQRERYITG